MNSKQSDSITITQQNYLLFQINVVQPKQNIVKRCVQICILYLNFRGSINNDNNGSSSCRRKKNEIISLEIAQNSTIIVFLHCIRCQCVQKTHGNKSQRNILCLIFCSLLPLRYVLLFIFYFYLNVVCLFIHQQNWMRA